MNFLKNIFKKYWFFIFFYTMALACVFILVSQNGFLLIFDKKQVLEKFGDQRLYIELAEKLLNAKIDPHPYSIGYPLFIAPFIFLTKSIQWQVISTYLVFIQGFFLFPLTIVILAAIFKKIYTQQRKLLKIIATVILAIFVFYELCILRHSADSLPFFLFFGLIPYSETLAIFTITLAYGIFILREFCPNRLETIFIGTLLVFSILTRITYVFFALPIILFYFRYFLEKKESYFFFGALFVSYLPQLFFNWIAYGNPLTSGYIWYWDHIKDQYVEIVKNIYHTNKVKMFSIDYLKINTILLLKKYIHYLIIIIFGLISAFSYKSVVSKKKLFFLSWLNISALIYLVVILSYLWSPLTHCIDRFLLPLAFLLPIGLFISISLYAKKNS